MCTVILDLDYNGAFFIYTQLLSLTLASDPPCHIAKCTQKDVKMALPSLDYLRKKTIKKKKKI